jgi:hypothetical protein
MKCKPQETESTKPDLNKPALEQMKLKPGTEQQLKAKLGKPN